MTWGSEYSSRKETKKKMNLKTSVSWTLTNYQSSTTNLRLTLKPPKELTLAKTRRPCRSKKTMLTITKRIYSTERTSTCTELSSICTWVTSRKLMLTSKPVLEWCTPISSYSQGKLRRERTLAMKPLSMQKGRVSIALRLTCLTLGFVHSTSMSSHSIHSSVCSTWSSISRPCRRQTTWWTLCLRNINLNSTPSEARSISCLDIKLKPSAT